MDATVQPPRTASPTGPPAPWPRRRVKGYLFEAQQLGCTRLLPGGRVGPAGQLGPVLGKHIPQEHLDTFLKTEGRVHARLKAFPHPNLAAPVDSAEDPEGCFLVFPAVHHDLHSHIREHHRLPEPEARCVFRQLASAVRHCHEHGIILRDMKLGKVYFTDRGRTRVTLADLEGAQVVDPSNPLLSDQKGSPAYVSPEVLTFQPYCGAAADMWALGVMLFVILTGSYPFQDNRPATLFQKIQQASAAVVFPSFVSKGARTLIRRLLSRNPVGRLTAEELCADSWVCEEDVEEPPVPESHPSDTLEAGVPDVSSPLPRRAATAGRRKRFRPPPLHIPKEIVTSGELDTSAPGARPLLSPGIETAPLSRCGAPSLTRKRSSSDRQQQEDFDSRVKPSAIKPLARARSRRRSDSGPIDVMDLPVAV